MKIVKQSPSFRAKVVASSIRLQPRLLWKGALSRSSILTKAARSPTTLLFLLLNPNAEFRALSIPTSQLVPHLSTPRSETSRHAQLNVTASITAPPTCSHRQQTAHFSSPTLDMLSPSLLAATDGHMIVLVRHLSLDVRLLKFILMGLAIATMLRNAALQESGALQISFSLRFPLFKIVRLRAIPTVYALGTHGLQTPRTACFQPHGLALIRILMLHLVSCPVIAMDIVSCKSM